MPAGKIIRADWVAPMSKPVMRDGAIAFMDGQILAVGKVAEIKSRCPDFSIRDLGQAVIMPGLINAHTHLELSACSCGERPPGRFTDWILTLPQRAAMDAQSIERSVTEATQTGIAQSIRFGVTCVGDISQYPLFSRPCLADSPLRAVSYAEALGVGKRRWRFDQLLAEAQPPRPLPQKNRRWHFSATANSSHITSGISPHAPYSVDLPGYQQALSLSRNQQMPFATHLSEWPDETDYLIHHTGMFREFLDRLGLWQDDVVTYPASPIRFAHAIGLLAEPALLAHVNYCDEQEFALLAAGRASVVYCPRTHQYFNHPPHRWRDMLAAGINVALGTDSCASSPDLNLVDEIRLLHQLAPEIPPEQLWKLITTNAAHAVRHKDLGSLQSGKAADFITFAISTDDPLRELLENNYLPNSVWVAGTLIH